MSKKRLMLDTCLALLFGASCAQANHLPPPDSMPPTRHETHNEEKTRRAAECLISEGHLRAGTWEAMRLGKAHFARFSVPLDKYLTDWKIEFYPGVREGIFRGVDTKKLDSCMRDLDPPPSKESREGGDVKENLPSYDK